MKAGVHAVWRRDWMASLSQLRRKRNRAKFLSSEAIAAFLVFAAVCFNMMLAFLNANLLGIDRGHVIVSEVLIVGIAVVACIVSANRLMIPWLSVIWLVVTVFIGLSLVRQSIDPKYLRDVLLIPVFIALGMTFSKGNIIKLFCALQVTILSVMIFEGLAPQAFAETFGPWNYYLSTRWSGGIKSWHSETGLYLSSLRPGGRLIFEWLGIHRLSSVFLEPVSLGNWTVIVTIFIAVFWRDMSRNVLIFLGLSNFALLVGCDGRFALSIILMILILSIFAHRLPRYIFLTYLPVVILLTIFLVMSFDVAPTGDNLLGRLARTVTIITNMTLPSFLGFDHDLMAGSADSGIAYLILTQSILGASVLWVAICLFQPPINRQAVLFMHGLCLYTALLLMVSFSFFSIKTAAPLWFLYGYVRARGFLEERMVRSVEGGQLARQKVPMQ